LAIFAWKKKQVLNRLAIKNRESKMRRWFGLMVLPGGLYN